MEDQKKKQQFQEQLDIEVTSDLVDSNFNIEIVRSGPPLTAYLANIKTVKVIDEDTHERTVLLLYFVQQNGQWFKSYLRYDPYFYIKCQENFTKEVIAYLEKKFDQRIQTIQEVFKIDLDSANHLSGRAIKYLKLNFRTINDLNCCKNNLKALVDKNSQKKVEMQINDFINIIQGNTAQKNNIDILEQIIDIREYDIPFYSRVCIDLNIRVCKWYQVSFSMPFISKLEPLNNMVERPDIRVLAFDIETSKQPLRFPDAKNGDQIMMISLVVEGDTILIANKEFCGKDLIDFEYSPKQEYQSAVKIFNEINEQELLQRFFLIIKQTRPLIITSYNGDKFDWPFIDERTRQNGMALYKEIGIYKQDKEEYYGRYIIHIDCFCWVSRDSYLPQGSQSLKNVTRAKLGYNPIDVDPEQMMKLILNQPQQLAEYAISDAVATYYLYKKHIQDFIFALGTIIPMNCDEVLRKGSGTLCENLLMAEAFKRNIIFPNKQKIQREKFYQGHLIDSETYIGGHVECLNSGVYRSDLLYNFQINKDTVKQLINQINDAIEFNVKIEHGNNPDDVINKQEVHDLIQSQLQQFYNENDSSQYYLINTKPLLYHLDVAAMYPNIILTNRLQPMAIVDDQKCSSCMFNLSVNNCKRNLEWQRKLAYFPLSRNEYEKIKAQLEIDLTIKPQNGKVFNQLSMDEQQKLIQQRVKKFCQVTYKRIHENQQLLKQNTVCMRENSFYVETIRSFRDRRYDYKALHKAWKDKYEEYQKQNNVQKQIEAYDLTCLFDSMQLAHKVILNSFYGYVMRKGARWYSMEMAAMVTHIGSSIIQDAKNLIDKIGKPLELDTDGIWCLLPNGFPENFQIKLKNNKILRFSYPCSMLNMLIYNKYKNPQYQQLVEQEHFKYETVEKMSIFFEIDGPYRAMIIPAAREEGKSLKKRYVVYNLNGTIAEIKGFEIKRRGELNIIKIFQQEIFQSFLQGTSLEECYLECGKVALKWLEILKQKGYGLDEQELIEYIGESRMLSKTLSEYDIQKGVALTSAKRMGEQLGEELLVGKGLNCSFVITKKPYNKPLNERAVPQSIFNADELVKRKFLRKWLKDGNLQVFRLHDLLDWEYYQERLINTIQKIILIPAAIQKIRNPIPEINYPDWLQKRIKEQSSTLQQQKLDQMFLKLQQKSKDQPINIENNKKAKIDFNSPHEKQYKLNLSNEQQYQTQVETNKNPFNMQNNFKNWLKCQKKLWIDNRVPQNNIFKKNSLLQMFQNKDNMVLNSVWHILQIYESDKKGIYILWIFLENHRQIISKKLKMDRIIYLHCYKDEEKIKMPSNEKMYKKVKKKLPRDKPIMNLYEFRLNEQDFIQSYNNFDYILTNPDYEGVYESKIPLSFRFIVNNGCICKFNQKRQGQRNISYSNQLFSIDDLYPMFSYEKPYLTNFGIQYTFLTYFEFNQTQGVWALFNQIQGEYLFTIIQKVNVMQNYKQIIKEILKNHPTYSLHNQPSIIIESFINNQDAVQYLQKYVSSFKEKQRFQTFFISSTPFSISTLHALGFTSLCNEFAVIPFPKISYDISNFSVLDWQKKSIQAVCEYYLEMEYKFNEHIDFCRWAQIPIGNLQIDKKTFATDIFYSRLLKAGNCINWYSETGKPDLGGVNDDDARQLISSEFLANSIAFPGIYLSYCVEIDIQLLVLNTILVSDELKNVDKEVVSMVEGEKMSRTNQQLNFDYKDQLDEFTTSKNSFKYLKILMNGWLKDIQINNKHADTLISNIHKWIVDEQSKLHDPQLVKMLNKLIFREFNYLLQKLKDLGALIIFADFQKIIICTSKDTWEAAENYISFILSSIISYPLFQFISLTDKIYWEALLFKDEFNYCGINSQSQQIHPEWNIIKYLPPIIQQSFIAVTSKYIHKLNEYKNCQLQKQQEKSTSLIQDYDKSLVEFSQQYIENNLMTSFYENIPDLQKQYRLAKNQFEISKQKLEQIKEDRRQERESRMKQKQNKTYIEKQSRNQNTQQENSNAIDLEIEQRQDEFESEKEDILSIDDEEEKEGEYQQLIQHFENKVNQFEDWNFPKQIIGQVTYYENIFLELIKFVCHILMLDINIQNQIISLKRNCLKMMGKSDFSHEAEFQEPTIKLIIKDVICKHCLVVVNIDIFREEKFLRNFICLNSDCSKQYDKEYIDYKLTRFLKDYLSFYSVIY